MSHHGLLCAYQSAGDRHPGVNAIRSHNLGARPHCQISRAKGRRDINRDIALVLVSMCLSCPYQGGETPSMGCRLHEAHSQGHRSQAVLMPETWSSQHKLPPARGQGNGPRGARRFEDELKARDGDALLRVTQQAGGKARARAEPRGERGGAGTLQEDATRTSASRS